MKGCFFLEDKIKYLRLIKDFLKNNKKFSSALSKVLRKLRETKNISQEEMVYYLSKCSVEFLDKCEKGEVNFPPYKLIKISKILGIELIDLYNIITVFVPTNKKVEVLNEKWDFRKK